VLYSSRRPPISCCHPSSHWRKRSPLVCALPWRAANTGPSAENINTASSALDRRNVSMACCGVWAIGPTTLKEVFTATSTPMQRPSEFAVGPKNISPAKIWSQQCPRDVKSGSSKPKVARPIPHNDFSSPAEATKEGVLPFGRRIDNLRCCWTSNIAQSQARAQEFLRIDRFAVDPCFVVQVRPGGSSSRSDPANDLANAHDLADFNADFR
jgi:hypothetical protein